MLTNRHVHRHNKESVVFQRQKVVILYKEPFVRNYLKLHMHEKFKKIIEKKSTLYVSVNLCLLLLHYANLFHEEKH